MTGTQILFICQLCGGRNPADAEREGDGAWNV